MVDARARRRCRRSSSCAYARLESQRAREVQADTIVVGGARGISRRSLASPSLRVLIGLFTAQTAVAGAVQVFIVVVAIELLDLGDGGVGFLNSAMGVGGARRRRARSLPDRGAAAQSRRSCSASSSGALPLIALGIWPVAALALVLLRPSSASANSLVDVAAFTLVQRAVPDEVLARVFGVIQMLWMGSVRHRGDRRSGVDRLAWSRGGTDRDRRLAARARS